MLAPDTLLWWVGACEFTDTNTVVWEYLRSAAASVGTWSDDNAAKLWHAVLKVLFNGELSENRSQKSGAGGIPLRWKYWPVTIH